MNRSAEYSLRVSQLSQVNVRVVVIVIDLLNIHWESISWTRWMWEWLLLWQICWIFIKSHQMSQVNVRVVVIVIDLLNIHWESISWTRWMWEWLLFCVFSVVGSVGWRRTKFTWRRSVLDLIIWCHYSCLYSIMGIYLILPGFLLSYLGITA